MSNPPCTCLKVLRSITSFACRTPPLLCNHQNGVRLPVPCMHAILENRQWIVAPSKQGPVKPVRVQKQCQSTDGQQNLARPTPPYCMLGPKLLESWASAASFQPQHQLRKGKMKSLCTGCCCCCWVLQCQMLLELALSYFLVHSPCHCE